jgi:hypothetical protein
LSAQVATLTPLPDFTLAEARSYLEDRTSVVSDRHSQLRPRWTLTDVAAARALLPLVEPPAPAVDVIEALVVQAIELKGTPYVRDACEAILAAHFRQPLTRLENEWDHHADLVKLMRETDPRSNR